MATYGYCRISTAKQSIERQVRNIKKEYVDVTIIKETFTGTKTTGRKEWNKLLKEVKRGDTIIFDSVSRMSRNAQEGFTAYQDLYNKGVSLVFIKEPHINTDTYKKALSNNVELTKTKADIIINAINLYLFELAKEQIQIAFEQAEKEVTDLHQRTKEGLVTAKMSGKQVGLAKGTKLVTKKSVEMKKKIQNYSRKFGGSLNDSDCIKLLGIARNSYYKYCKEIQQEELINE